MAIATVLLVRATLAPSAQAGEREGSPLALAMTYHVAPGNRIAFRSALEQTTLPLLKRLKDSHVIEGYQVFFNRYVDSAAWEAMAILSFPKEAGAARWNEIERETPAGLSRQALELTSSIDTAPLDFIREKSADATPGTGVFLVIPYQVTVPVPEYIAYLDGYTLPQADGWMEEGVLAHYGVYLPRYPAGRPWQALLVLEYRNDQALGQRDAVVAKVRGRLKDNPAWKAMSDNKKNVRIELMPAVADSIGR